MASEQWGRAQAHGSDDTLHLVHLRQPSVVAKEIPRETRCRSGHGDAENTRMRVVRFPEAVERSAAIDAWLDRQPIEFRSIARMWFERMRACGDDVRELMHDGAPTACVEDAAFGYVTCSEST